MQNMVPMRDTARLVASQCSLRLGGVVCRATRAAPRARRNRQYVSVTDPWDDVKKRFTDGLARLAPLLEEHKFQRMAREFGKGSGGPFAEATFGRDQRSITLWLRGNSLSVIYRCGDAEADHLRYMREVAGIGGANKFPTYNENAVDSFAAVRRDLEAFGSDFLTGDCERLHAAARSEAQAAAGGPMRRLAAIEAALKGKKREN